MNDEQIIYDALTMPVVDPGRITVALIGFIMASVIATAGWMRSRKEARPWPFRGITDLLTMRLGPDEKHFRGMIGLVGITLMAAWCGWVLIYSVILTATWRYNYSHRQYDALDGCVAQFDETVYSDHDIGVDKFMLQGQRFTLSDSETVGYHVSHHHGSPIQDGVHLRAFAQGPHLLRIGLVADPCPGSDEQQPSRTDE